VPEDVNPGLIFDVGPAEGSDTAFYLRKGFNVVAIEANPKSAETIRQRFPEEIQSGRLTLLNRAAYDRSGDDVEVWDTPNPRHSSVEVNLHRVSSSFTVKTIDWAEAVQLAGIPYYCKIDIEGAEENFMRSMQRSSSRPTYISVECHTIDSIGMLFSLGYRKFKLINQTTLHAASIPEPALEGLYVNDSNHVLGSGMFGRECQGVKWFNFQEITGLYDAIHRLLQYPEMMRSWYDCHAWMP
jgi:FkbM family methyltransferase